jgi:putative glycerol-1-phosphate prenyltransferase
MSVFSNLNQTIKRRGSAYIVLIDPDRKNMSSLDQNVRVGNNSNVDAFFVGGSLMMDSKSHKRVSNIKETSEIPLILFPGGTGQLSQHYDAMLFMSVISGRNSHYLIGEQVIAAPVVKDLGIETISTGYILVDGGACSTVEFMSDTRPIPTNRTDIIIAHALAGQYLGMEVIYLESGSGARLPVTKDVVTAVRESIDIPIIVGGGIKSPETASELVRAGASIIVTGTITEHDSSLMSEIADAVHWRRND